MYLQFTEEVEVAEGIGLNLTDVVHAEIPKIRERKQRVSGNDDDISYVINES